MDAETLLKRRAADTLDTVNLGDLAVTVRGLSRDEVQVARAFENEDKRDRLLATMAFVDPEMSPQEVAEWFKGAPAGDTVKVLAKIAELSGLAEDARKSAVPAA